MKTKLALFMAVAAIAVGGAASPSVASQTADLSKSLVPGYPDVVAEYMQIPGFKAAGTPDALNTATFLRLRSADDGDHPKAANAVIIAMPGFSSTPPHWLWLATQLVHKANERTCDDGQPCRVEVWVMQRRGANLADTIGLREARAKGDPKVALDYYYGPGAVAADPSRGGALTVEGAPGAGGAKWRVLTEHDLAFMADWGFETYAGDADHMIGLIREKSGAHNIFLAGHSQGGAFVSDYAGRLQADGKRGLDKLSGLIYLDAQTTPGTGVAGPAEMQAYVDHITGLRTGKAPVYTGGGGPLGNLAGPQGAVQAQVVFTYFDMADPNAEAIFPQIAKPTSPKAGEAFRYQLRSTWQAFAGASFDVDPLPGSDIQIPIIRALGEGLGRFDFRPVKGTESLCDLAPAASMGFGPPPKPATGIGATFNCVASPAMIDPNKVYGWLDGGGDGAAPGKVGKATLWMKSAGFAPARSNVRPVTVTFADSGRQTIDASNMVASNFYPSERHDFDANFFGKWSVIKAHANGVDIDMDKTGLNLPVYVARRSPSPKGDNPFPHVTDYTEINRTGTYQSDPAKAVSPIDPKINVALYNHTDIVSADDSLAGKVRPGEPGASAISDTLIDWVLKRSKGRADVPSPKALGVVETY